MFTCRIWNIKIKDEIMILKIVITFKVLENMI